MGRTHIEHPSERIASTVDGLVGVLWPAEWAGPARKVRIRDGRHFWLLLRGNPKKKSVFPLIFFYVLRSFSESRNHSCKESHGLFSRFWLLTAVGTVLVATIAANKSGAVQRQQQHAGPPQGWFLVLKEKTFFFKNIFLIEGKTTNETTSY